MVTFCPREISGMPFFFRTSEKFPFEIMSLRSSAKKSRETTNGKNQK